MPLRLVGQVVREEEGCGEQQGGWVVKLYKIEFSEAELLGYDTTRMRAPTCSAEKRLYDMIDMAKADREAEDLRLPWRYEASIGGPRLLIGGYSPVLASPAIARLASAAPELLKAVQACNAWHSKYPTGEWVNRIQPLIECALRKVASGVPE
jgi:hypothetical protein